MLDPASDLKLFIVISSPLISVLTNSHISIQTRKRTLECYIEPILYVWMRGLDNIQTSTEKTRGSRNMVPEKNDENIMDS